MIAMGAFSMGAARGRQCSSAGTVSVLRHATAATIEDCRGGAVAHMLLRTALAMDEDPGHVIKALRLALDMSQADFARASGWATSTISAWERGKSRPSRLAFKTILAFAEERGVRYRPPARPLLPAPRASASDAHAAEPLPVRVALDAHRGDPGWRAERWTPSDARTAPLPTPDPRRWSGADPRHASAHDDPPRWSAEASFRVSLGRAPARARGLRSAAEALAVVGAMVCVVFLVGAPASRPNPAPARPSDPAAVIAPVPAPRRPAASRRASGALVVRPPKEERAPAVGDATIAATEHAPLTPDSDAADIGEVAVATTGDPRDDANGRGILDPEAAAETDPSIARLDSVVRIGDERRATFRTANDSVTVLEGEWVGTQHVDKIGTDAVTLVTRTGDTRVVRVGHQTTLE
jgi:transcriptional regulator with XRE-family HTH domain